MWYSKIINEHDGLATMLSMFDSEESFLEHFILNTIFFHPDEVTKQAEELKGKIDNGDKIPVRFSMKSKKMFHFENEKNINGKSSRTFKNKKEAKEFAEKNELVHTVTKIPVIIDKDGNYFVRSEIYKYTGYRVSQGAISDIQNYMIGHIWANTDNPYFFTSLWNFALIPQYMAFILDKPDANSELVRKIKVLTEAVCFILYKPNELLDKKLIDGEKYENGYTELYDLAKSFVESDRLTFIRPKAEQTEEIEPQVDTADIVERLENCDGNKDFAFTLLELLKEARFDFVQEFTDKTTTRNICKLSYPLLVDVTGDSKKVIEKKARPVKSDMYYKKPFFEIDNKQYIVCNDWYEKNKEHIIEWLEGTSISMN